MAINAEKPEWLNEVNADLAEILENCVESNWDGQNAIGLNTKSFVKAVAIVSDLSKIVGIKKPITTLTDDGSIGFCWDDGIAILDLEVGSDSMHFVYLNRKTSEEIDIDQNDLREIASLLSK